MQKCPIPQLRVGNQYKCLLNGLAIREYRRPQPKQEKASTSRVQSILQRNRGAPWEM